MRHIVGTVFAISLAGVAAIAATTAYLNSPLRIGPATTNQPTATPPAQAPAPEAPAGSTPTAEGGAMPAPPADSPATPAGGANAPTPGAATPAAEGANPDEADKDPYEGIAPEDLPPDLQYNADSSVSFPTNI
jgi:hypothetical protein